MLEKQNAFPVDHLAKKITSNIGVEKKNKLNDKNILIN